MSDIELARQGFDVLLWGVYLSLFVVILGGIILVMFAVVRDWLGIGGR